MAATGVQAENLPTAAGQPMPDVGRRTLAAPLRWGHWVVPIGVELGIVAIIGVVALGLAVLQFERTE
jgi:hypothetical protein